MMIQDIAPHRLFNSYRPDAKPEPDSPAVIFRRGEFLLHVDDDTRTVAFPAFGQLGIRTEGTYLFSLDDKNYFLAEQMPGEEDMPEGFSFRSIRQMFLMNYQPKEYVYAAFTALQLAEWYEQTAFCGRCGARNENDAAERARVCPVCGNRIYPRINPAVIVGVTNGDRILLTKYKAGFSHNALIAGFTEIGETVEETVAREVMEEAGIRVKNLRYYKSQPWGIASDILMGFFCDVDGDDTITMDNSELKYAEWVRREDIILQPVDYSLTNEMMRLFKEGGIKAC